MVIKPSNGRCGSGRTIFASTCASTLRRRVSCAHRGLSGAGRYATVFCRVSTRHGRALGRMQDRAVARGGSRGRQDGCSGRGRPRRSLSLRSRAMVGASKGGPGRGARVDVGQVLSSLVGTATTTDGVLPRELLPSLAAHRRLLLSRSLHCHHALAARL